MAINDPYDRSGQYAGGDRGSPVSGYGGLANENPDRRDVAVGTMMGEGGPRDNKHGYAGVLDSIENRISAIQGGANYGTRNDSTLEGVAQARKGAEYNAWSPKENAAYGQASRGSKNTPRSGKEAQMYDQAMEVYDDYYQDGTFKGVAQGGTFYQNDALLSGKKAGSYQRNMQEKYGSVPIGIAGHVATGPGLSLGRPGASYDRFDPSITGSFGGDFAPSVHADALETPEVESFVGQTGVNTLGQNFNDPMVSRQQSMTPAAPRNIDTMGQPLTQLTGNMGTNLMMGGIKDPIAARMQGSMTNLNTPAFASAPPESVVQAVQKATAAPMQRDDFWTPGPIARASGSNATGRETSRTRDGVIHDNAGAYGGKDAFGPNDPFGGLGYSNKGYADVIDSFDATMGISRTVTDKRGTVIGQGYMPGRGGGGGMEATGHDASGNASVGDGSYADSSGRNDNNPQGIL